MNLVYALIMGAFIGGVAGYIGSLMVTKRMALMGGALGHMTLPGVALALIYGFDVSLGALGMLVVGVLLVWFFEWRTRLPMEALTAVVFAASLGVAFLFLPHEEVEIALIGDISQITLWGTVISAAVAVAVFITVNRIMDRMVLSGISEDVARSEGVNVKLLNLLYLVCIALTVALGVRIVGGLMTAALVAIPAAASRILSRSLSMYAYLGMALGALSCLVGIGLFKYTGIAAGPLIIITSSAFFLLAVIFKRK